MWDNDLFEYDRGFFHVSDVQDAHCGYNPKHYYIEIHLRVNHTIRVEFPTQQQARELYENILEAVKTHKEKQRQARKERVAEFSREKKRLLGKR